MPLAGRLAVVTGAASGIGRAVAISLARRGCAVALIDLNAAGLADTVAQLPAGTAHSQHVADVADRNAVAALPAAITAAHPAQTGVAVLVNNAGVALGGTFDQVSEADFEWLFGVNVWGVVRMTRAFLPLLRAGGEARLVNLSSVFGLVSPPGQTAYSASKFAVRGFSNALRHELAGTGVGVSVVHPGGVATSIADNARIPAGTPPDLAERGRRATNRMLTLAPATAGEVIVRGIERRRSRILVGTDAKIISWLERIAPVSHWALMQRLLTRQ